MEAGRPGLGLLLGLRRYCIPCLASSRLAAGPRDPRMVGAGDQPAGLHLLRHLGRGWLCRSKQGLSNRPRRGELEHLARRGVFFGMRSRDTLYWSHIEVAASATSSCARACRRADCLTSQDPGPKATSTPRVDSCELHSALANAEAMEYAPLGSGRAKGTGPAATAPLVDPARQPSRLPRQDVAPGPPRGGRR